MAPSFPEAPPPTNTHNGVPVLSPKMASGEESMGVKEARAWPKGKVTGSFLSHLETSLGRLQGGGDQDSGLQRAHGGRRQGGWQCERRKQAPGLWTCQFHMVSPSRDHSRGRGLEAGPPSDTVTRVSLAPRIARGAEECGRP